MMIIDQGELGALETISYRHRSHAVPWSVIFADADDDEVDVTPTELVGGELWDGEHAGGGEEEGGCLEDFLMERIMTRTMWMMMIMIMMIMMLGGG